MHFFLHIETSIYFYRWEFSGLKAKSSSIWNNKSNDICIQTIIITQGVYDFPLKDIVSPETGHYFKLPVFCFSSDKRRIFCLQQLELHIYIIQASKELIIFLNNIWSTWNFKWLELLNEPPLWENSTLSKFRRRSPAHLLSFIATFADMVCGMTYLNDLRPLLKQKGISS